MSDKKILVVDDEEELLELVEKTLTKEGYAVTTAKNAAEAIEQARLLTPDLILVDIVLPDKEGSEAVRILREDPKTKDIAVVFLSGIVTREREEEPATEVLVKDRYYRALSKPFTAQELLLEVRKAVGE